MKQRGAQGPNPVPVPQSLAISPGFIKKGNVEGLNIKVSMHFCQDHYLTAKAQLVCVPGHHHLQQTQNEL